MTRWLQLFFDPAYLYALNPGPLGRLGIVYLGWAALLVGGWVASLRWWERTRHVAAKTVAWACGIGSALLGLRLLSPYLVSASQVLGLSSNARYLLLDLWTARVWPVAATSLALLALSAYGLSLLDLPPLIRVQVEALLGGAGCDHPGRRTLTRGESAILGLLHLIGLAWLWRWAGRPPWWALPSLVLLSFLPLTARPRRLRLETMVPLLPAYVSAVAVSVLERRLGIEVGEYQAFPMPDPWSPWFNVAVVWGAGVAYTLLIQLRLVAHGWDGDARDRALPLALAVLTGVWFVATVAIHRTHGVTASDPYCYVQMTVDLAQTGLPLHDFPLAGLAAELGLPTWPTVHVGYQPPFYADLAPTMWPTGWSTLMVPLYWLGGLGALYLAAPLMAALSLGATWGLVCEVLRDRNRGLRWTVAALTCFLVATSPEGSERTLVPMADAAAQLFTTLTLWMLVRGTRSRPVLHSLAAGATLGTAYWIRHPQLPLALAALVALPFIRAQGAGCRAKRILAALAAFGLGAFVLAVPDLVYHRAVFGGWLHAESTEWYLLSAGNVRESFWAVLRQGLLRREELGFVAPFALYGAWVLWRRHRRSALILLLGVGAALLFHLFYEALRPRDLIALLPVLYLPASYGLVELWRRAEARCWLGSGLWLLCCITLLIARSERVLAMLWRDDVITFGHMREDQYRDLLALRTITPQDAVIGSMLNGGAIELFARRSTVHPAPWEEEQLWRWTDALLERGRPFYVLDDGEEMPPVLARLRRRYAVRWVRSLDLPYFALGGGNLPGRASLYRIEPAP